MDETVSLSLWERLSDWEKELFDTYILFANVCDFHTWVDAPPLCRTETIPHDTDYYAAACSEGTARPDTYTAYISGGGICEH